MDSFAKCRLASEKVAWSFEESLGDLSFDFSKNFLPSMLCGHQLPEWMSSHDRQALNQIRGYSYAHIFDFVEEFIVQQTCQTATNYVHTDTEAVSAVLTFANEETKHQRMFALVKDLLSEGLGFRPAAIPNKEATARDICRRSPFAVYLLTLTLEWLTQRHYVECFTEEESTLDPGFVRIFRLHWTEEAQHARVDALELKSLSAGMTREELSASITEFRELLHLFSDLLLEQDKLDLQSFETLRAEPLTANERESLLQAMHQEYLWTFLVSGLEHKAFQMTYNSVVPSGLCSVMELSGHVGARHSTMPFQKHSTPTSSPNSPTLQASDGSLPGTLSEGTASKGLALVVDDQDYIRDFACSALEHLGFEVLTARNGQEGIQCLEAHAERLCFVLLDVTMPGISGGEFLALMDTLQTDVPVILSSGHMRNDVLANIPSARLVGYLQKPYLLNDLSTAVDIALASRSGADATPIQRQPPPQ